jgi:hypothetical protein
MSGDRPNAPPQPANSARQADIILAQGISRRFDARVRGSCANSRLDRTE